MLKNKIMGSIAAACCASTTSESQDDQLNVNSKVQPKDMSLMGKSCPEITFSVTGGEQSGKMTTLHKTVGEAMQKTAGKTTIVLYFYGHF